jgi:hypothetical protein
MIAPRGLVRAGVGKDDDAAIAGGNNIREAVVRDVGNEKRAATHVQGQFGLGHEASITLPEEQHRIATLVAR